MKQSNPNQNSLSEDLQKALLLENFVVEKKRYRVPREKKRESLSWVVNGVKSCRVSFGWEIIKEMFKVYFRRK